MPRRDKRGPEGKGALTGRGMGPCGQEGETNRVFERGRGTGLGRGAGMGFGRGRFWEEKTLNLGKEEEKKILSAQLGEIEDQKQRIEKTLKKLEEEE